ncbi:MAG TPA: hypothetical protein VKU88_09945, partial [Acidimicrobiales bacterium]|nr:hypothetical protein [Acidimicrobiales bacterium]
MTQGDPFVARAVRVAYHLRRYGVIYLFTLLAVIGMILLPTVNTGSTRVSAGSVGGSPYSSGAGTSSGAAAGSQQAAASAASGAATAAATGGGAASGAGGAASAAGSQQAAGSAGSGAAATASGGSSGDQVGTGVTVAGVACRPGVRQLPYSDYADPCVSKWSGNNGGATWNGVTSSTITIAIRHTADSSGANAVATEAGIEAAGGVS